MSSQNNILELVFDGSATDRSVFLRDVRDKVKQFTGETMTLDALVIEAVKNIFDHAQGKGSVVIVREGNTFGFQIKDEGTEPVPYNAYRSRSTKAGNGINLGAGLSMIEDIAASLGMNLGIDASRGLRLIGAYRPRN